MLTMATLLLVVAMLCYAVSAIPTPSADVVRQTEHPMITPPPDPSKVYRDKRNIISDLSSDLESDIGSILSALGSYVPSYVASGVCE